jgi:hypothetical protein
MAPHATTLTCRSMPTSQRCRRCCSSWLQTSSLSAQKTLLRTLGEYDTCHYSAWAGARQAGYLTTLNMIYDSLKNSCVSRCQTTGPVISLTTKQTSNLACLHMLLQEVGREGTGTADNEAQCPALAALVHMHHTFDMHKTESLAYALFKLLQRWLAATHCKHTCGWSAAVNSACVATQAPCHAAA